MHRTSLAAAVLLLFLLLTGPAAAAGTIQLDIPQGQLAVGQTAEWNLNLTGADHMKTCALDIIISGDGKGIIEFGEGTLPGSCELNNASGRIVWKTSGSESATSGTIATVRFTAEKAGRVTVSIVPVEITEKSEDMADVKEFYTLYGGTVEIIGGKSVYLQLPTSPLTVGVPFDIPVIISGAANLKSAAVTFTTDASGAGDFTLLKGDLSDGGYQNFPTSFSPDGTAKIVWMDTNSHQGNPVTFVTLRCTPHTSGSIPFSITVNEIIERDFGDTTVDYAVSGGPVPVVGAAVIKVADGIVAPLNKETIIPVSVTGANNMKTAQIQVLITENGGKAGIELVQGDVSTTTFQATNPSGSNSYVGQIDWTSTASVTDGILFYLKVTPNAIGDLPVSLRISQIEERGTQESGQELVDATGRYSAVGATVRSSFLNKLSDNTVPPSGGFVAGDGLWSAITPARVVYNASPEERNMAPPQITWGGKSVPVNETLIVEELSASGTVLNTSTIKSPAQDAAGNVTVPAATKADAVELRITFEGRPLGDVDGNAKITLADSTRVMKNYVGLTKFSEIELLYGDVNGDGKITLADSTRIMKNYVGLSDEHYQPKP